MDVRLYKRLICIFKIFWSTLLGKVLSFLWHCLMFSFLTGDNEMNKQARFAQD